MASQHIRRAFWCAVLVVVVLALAAWQEARFYNAVGFTVSADDSNHVINAQHWRAQRWKVPGTTWLPLPAVLNGFALDLYPDPFLTPRAFNQLAGLCVVGLIAMLGSMIGRSLLTAFVSALLAACFFPRVVLSAVPLTEILFTFFLLASLVLIWRWLQTGKLFWCAGSALCLACCTAIRYEGWIVAAVFGGVLTVHTLLAIHRAGAIRSLVLVMTAALFLSAFPVAWLFYNHACDGTWFGFMTGPGERYFRIHNPESHIRLLWEHGAFNQFLAQNTVSGNLLGVAAIPLLAWKNPVFRWWFTIPLLTLVALAAANLSGTALPTHNFWRIAAPYSMALLPLTAHVLVQGPRAILRKQPRLSLLLTAVALSLLMLLFARQTLDFPGGSSRMDQADRQMAKVISELLQPFDQAQRPRVILLRGDWHMVHVQASISFPQSVLVRSPKEVIDEGTLDLAGLRAKRVGWVLAGKEFLPEIEALPGTRTESDESGRFVLITLPSGTESRQ